MDIVIEALKDSEMLRHRSVATKRYCSTLRVYTDPQSGIEMRTGSVDRDGSAASTPEARKRSHCAHPGQVSFDERSCKLATLAVESFRRPGKEGSDLIGQIAATIVGGTDGSSLTQRGVCKKRLFQIISVTAQVAILRRVHRYKLALRGRQASRGREK